MDPISVIMTALVLGIANGLKPTAEQAIQDLYTGLKTIIIDKYKVSLANLESKPDSTAQREAVKENLAELDADADQILLDKAKLLIETLRQTNPQAVKGVVIEDIRAVNVNISRVKSTGDGVKAKGVTATGDFNISDVTAGDQNDPN